MLRQTEFVASLRLVWKAHDAVVHISGRCGPLEIAWSFRSRSSRSNRVEVLDVDAEIDLLARRLAKARAVKQGMMQELLTGRTRLGVAEGAE